jgi:TolB-like protein
MHPRLRALVACAALLVPGLAGGEPRIAVLPVVVHSGASDSSYLSDGLSDMLSARLEQLGGMAVVREASDAKPPARIAQAVERGKALGADYVVFGSFTQFGDGASLDLQCAPVRAADPEAVRSLFVQSGAIGDIIPKLDDVVDKIAYFVLGDAAGRTAVSARGTAATPIRDLLKRLEELERTVYGRGGATAPAPAPAATPAPEASDGDAAAEPAPDADAAKLPVSTGASGRVQGPSKPPRAAEPPAGR